MAIHGKYDLKFAPLIKAFRANFAERGKMRAALVLVAERGPIDYDPPIARQWPGFAAAGKDQVASMQMQGKLDK